MRRALQFVAMLAIMVLLALGVWLTIFVTIGLVYGPPPGVCRNLIAPIV